MILISDSILEEEKVPANTKILTRKRKTSRRRTDRRRARCRVPARAHQPSLHCEPSWSAGTQDVVGRPREMPFRAVRSCRRSRGHRAQPLPRCNTCTSRQTRASRSPTRRGRAGAGAAQLPETPLLTFEYGGCFSLSQRSSNSGRWCQVGCDRKLPLGRLVIRAHPFRNETLALVPRV